MDFIIVIVSWNTKDLLCSCLRSVFLELATSQLKATVFVVDNNSFDGSADMVRQDFPEVQLIANTKNLGFAAANNQILLHHSAPFYLILNPDTEVLPGAFSTLLKFMESHPKAGIVAPQLLNTDRSIQRSCRSFPTIAGMTATLLGLKSFRGKKAGNYLMLDFDHNSVREVDQPEGACLLVRGGIVEKLGAFDERFFMLFEEVDWCYRIKQAGFEIWFDPEAKIIHHYGQSIKQVKAKMIYYSHRGFYRYITKHSSSILLLIFRPLLYCGLMVVAGLRIFMYVIKSKIAKFNLS
jgi:GT2 family glycosyltransferase